MTAERTVAHGVFSFVEGGAARLAVRGDRITVADETVEKYEPFGVFEPAAPDADAHKAEWITYAESLGIDTAGLTKQEIIDAVEEYDNA